MWNLADRFEATLLGVAVADAFGAPFEGCPADAVYREFGPIRNVYARPPVDARYYTDDAQMTIALAEALADHGQIDPEADLLAPYFARHYQPERGYGQGARRVIEAMARGGEEWKSLAASIFPGGSLGNGAAMRVAPVGLMFFRDLETLVDQAYRSALPTHRHPVGIDGARVLALAVAYVLREGEGRDDPPPFDRAAFFDFLLQFAMTDEFAGALRAARAMTADDVIGVLGHSLEAHRSVPTALACFAAHPDSFAETVCRAVAQGGDTDTIAAMAAAVSAARLGTPALPAHLLALLENGPHGRDAITHLAHRLHDRFRADNESRPQ